MKPRILNNHIVFQLENIEQLRACVPGLKEAQGYAAVPLSLESARILRNLGIEAPSPIRTRYGWPIMAGRAPRAHQIATAEAMTLNPRFHCHNAPRTGKTLSTLWALDYLQQERIVNRALIVAPLSTLERAWGDEIFLNFPHKRFTVLYGSREKRLRLLKEDSELFIVNHDGVEILLKELMLRGDIDIVVYDELSGVKNAKTNRWKAINSLVNQRGVYTWCWGLTGTPVSNEPTDAYGQAKLVRPESVKNISYTAFKNAVMQQFGQFRWCVRKGAEEIVARVLSPSIRFDRSVVTSMEPCLIERHAELSAEQKHHINKLLREAVTEIDGSTVSAVNAAVLLSKIVQTACGVVYGSGGEFLKVDFGPRLKVLEEAIAENMPEKVLVFFPFTGALNAVASELSKKWSVAVVDGGVSAGKRNQIYADFQAKKDPQIIVAHPQCMSHGLELTRASLIIWGAPITNNEIYMQACCRIDGGGQKSKIDILHISSTPTERKIYAALQSKGKLQSIVLDLLKEGKA